jgi:hypothetical protein
VWEKKGVEILGLGNYELAPISCTVRGGEEDCAPIKTGTMKDY